MTEEKLNKLQLIWEESNQGPAEKRLGEDGVWRIKFPEIPRGFNGDCQGYAIPCDETDADLIITAYNEIPDLIAALIESRTALKKEKNHNSKEVEKFKNKLNNKILTLECAEVLAKAKIDKLKGILMNIKAGRFNNMESIIDEALNETN